MENAELTTSSAPAPAPIAVTAVVAVGGTALAVLNVLSGTITTGGVVTLGLMLSMLWVGLFFDVYIRQAHKAKRRKHSTDQRPSHAPRLSTPHNAFAG